MQNLRVLALIFFATLICNALSVLYQRFVLREKYLKATTISVIMAGLSLYVWKHVIKEDDMNGASAFITYLAGDALGVYLGFKVNVEKELPHKKT